MALHPPKWRKTCDPFSLSYHDFRPTEILGYPHARNDVFHARGVWHDQEITVYIKVARQNNSAIANDVSLLSQMNAPVFPKVIDADMSPVAFSVTTALPGLRLSTIVGENLDMSSLSYMEEYGAALGKLHCLKPSASSQESRRFHHRPSCDMLEKLNLAYMDAFFQNAPASSKTVFCHGDFHYANVLWENHRISGILDFELSGYGNRDFDIAWAMFCRPGQRFLQTSEEQQLFLQGYARHGDFNADAVRYYMAQCYVYFLYFNDDAPEYCQYIRSWLATNCT